MVAGTLSSLLLLLSCVQLAFCNNGVCTSDSQCKEGQGDCDHDEECFSGLVCGIDNCHTQFNGWENVSSLPSDADCCMKPRCDLLGPDAWNCCGRLADSSGNKVPCGVGQGDCDHDSDCAVNLICGVDNCHKFEGKESVNETMDCCMQVTCDAGPQAWSCCTNSGNGCNEGEGDCDSDYDCANNLVCGVNNCQEFNPDAHADADCCIQPLKNGTNLDWNKACTNHTQCQAGQGDCDHDQNCQGDLICGINNCKASGANETADCCKVAACDGSNTAWSCCSPTDKCGHGQGDCDTHDDCEDGMFCGKNNCNEFSSEATDGADCCFEPVCNGHSLAFNCCGPDKKCAEGFGDCDADEDCADGLVCGFNNCGDFVGNTVDGVSPSAEADCCKPGP